MRDGALAVMPRDLVPAAAASAYSFPRAAETDANPSPAKTIDEQDFSARMRLLVERAGGTGALAACCGVTARTVRNWCNGHSDISRERCLVLARAMRISPLWLISGEGGMAEASAEPAPAAERLRDVDSVRLAAALQVLQSYIVLVGGSLSIAQRAEALAELYDMLAQPGPADATRVVAFHKTLAARLRSYQASSA